MLPTIARQHIVAATSAELSFQGVDSDGEPANPGDVTVTVTPSDPFAAAIGVDLATTGSGSYPRTASLAPALTETLDQLTATWKNAAGVVLSTTLHDIVGAPLITLADFRRREPRQAAVVKQDFLLARFETDAMFRRVTGRSFVPRFEVESIDSRGGRLVLAHPDVRSVAWATDEDGVALSLADVVVFPGGVVDIGCTYGKVTVGYSHGMDAPPDDVVGAAAKLIRTKLTEGSSMIPSRADSFDTQLGTASFTPRPGYGRAHTAIDEVDEVLNAYRRAQVA